MPLFGGTWVPRPGPAGPLRGRPIPTLTADGVEGAARLLLEGLAQLQHSLLGIENRRDGSVHRGAPDRASHHGEPERPPPLPPPNIPRTALDTPTHPLLPGLVPPT